MKKILFLVPILFSMVAFASNANFTSEKGVMETANVKEISAVFGNCMYVIQHVSFIGGKFISYETIHYTDAISADDCAAQAQSHADGLNGW